MASGTPGGDDHQRRSKCRECRGKGRLPGMVKTTGMGSGMGSAFGPCPTCDGVGYLTDDDDSDE
jgi:DnaJ-class molecular chaperone